MEHDSSLNNEQISNTRCTFCFPCFGSRHSTTTEPWWERVRISSVSRGFMKIREWSEIVAGPRWKTFIRRFNRNKIGGFRHAGKYQYDPLSYSLNFDEGQNGEYENDSPDGFRNFSARYVAAVPTLKSDSTDLEQNVVVSSSE